MIARPPHTGKYLNDILHSQLEQQYEQYSVIQVSLPIELELLNSSVGYTIEKSYKQWRIQSIGITLSFTLRERNK